MPAPTKSKRPKARDPKKAQAFLDAQAVKRGNAADSRRAKEKAMDEKDKMPAKKAVGGKMGKKPMKKMAKGGMTRGCGAATKGKRYSRAG